jgi:L-alanine-DL-glutamate epimerase-like enolase superfamily enzyme
MKIKSVSATPLLVPYGKPYYWANGVVAGAHVVLITIEADDGLVGYGESIGTPTAEGIVAFVRAVEPLLLSRSPFDNSRLLRDAYHTLFQAQGTCSSPRFAGQVFAGIEMALWDLMGKKVGLPVHRLMGGAVRDEIQYFGFAQGDRPDEVAADAASLAKAGFEVIYVKVGRGSAIDLEVVSTVRRAIGPDKRMRVDPNEQWAPLDAARMARALLPFGVEMIEQPTVCESVSALAHVRSISPIAIAADQVCFTPFDAYDVCRSGAADLIVIGLHETGGLLRFKKVADIAEAAGINVCIHGLYETGITTCAANQVAATIANLDDANQYMNHFLEWDIIKSPDLRLESGRLRAISGPGLGFELDPDAVGRAAELHSRTCSAGLL